jgi:hypothetical protein
VAARLLQLQIQKRTETEAHRHDKQHRRLEQRQPFQRTARGLMRVLNGDRQKLVL